MATNSTPSVPVQTVDGDAPVKKIDPAALRGLGRELAKQFDQYASDRKLVEQKWLRNLRQYLGIYDPGVNLADDRSQAYPRVTRVKCISMLSRIMNLMFPGNESNWSLKASPSAEMDPNDVMQIIQPMLQQAQQSGQPLDPAQVQGAVQEMADQRAKEMSDLIEDQLQELGGDQTADYIKLNRKVVKSGIMYGLGVLRGPFVKETANTAWRLDQTGQAVPRTITTYKPQFAFTPVWDFFPDMTCNELTEMDGYYVRMVLSKSQLRKLRKRDDFFEGGVNKVIEMHPKGNYKARDFESQLKSMGTAAHVKDEETSAGHGRYEILVWHGPVSANTLMHAGAEVKDADRGSDVEAEVWIVGNEVIKADVSPWYKLGIDIRTAHTFVFDDDDTSPVGNGVPNIMRDSQMAVSASARMLLDNASVVCGPNIEVNTDLLTDSQDRTSIHAYKVWEREGIGMEAQTPAVRNIAIDSHMTELLSTIELFMNFADTETFIGPATGGDMSQGPSEPMRTAAGASMLRGDAALPFKDIIRNFDSFTQSVIHALVMFNMKFNPNRAKAGDYNVIARGATSLIAKEVRGMQLDQMAATLTPEDKMHVDDRKFLEARFAVRDLEDYLLPQHVAQQNIEKSQAQNEEMQKVQMDTMRAELRKTLAEAFKDITQGQKNSAAADANAVETAVGILEAGLQNDMGGEEDAEITNGASGQPPQASGLV